MTPPALEELARLPQLPDQVSPDGSEIWDWAARFSDAVHLRCKIGETERRIAKIGTECGDCRHWMTRSCPKEKPNNQTGRSQGPSCSQPICKSFVECFSATSLYEKLTAELSALRSPATLAREVGDHE